MKIEIYTEEQIGNEMCFAVHMLPTLPFPDSRKTIKDLKMLSIVAARYNQLSGWSYICLNSNAKQAIGDAMTGAGCDPIKWYWIVALED